MSPEEDLFEELGGVRIAHIVANEKCWEHFGFKVRRPLLELDPNGIDPRYWDMLSAANEIVCDLILKNGYRCESTILKFARKRMTRYLSYEYAVISKPKHWVDKEREASHAAGEPERSHYLHQNQTSDSYADENGDSRAFEFFQTRRHRHDEREEHLYDLADPDLYSLCRNGFEREIVHLLTTTCLTRAQLAKQLGIGKTKLQRIIGDIKNRDLMSKRKPKTADPKYLRKVQPLAHDNCSPQSGCPVSRLKTFCCRNATDRLIVDLYRDGLDAKQIAAKMKPDTDWIKNQLGIIAYRYITM